MIKKEIKNLKESFINRDFLFLKKSSDFARGSFKVYEHIHGLSKIIYLESFLKNVHLQNIVSKKFENLKEIPENLIQPIDYQISEIRTPSEVLYKVKEYYNYYQVSLSEEIKNKKKYHSNFNSEELTHLFYNMMEINSYLQENELYHGFLNPEFIFISSNRFFLHMMNNFFYISEDIFFEEIKKKNKKYFAPEIYEKILFPKKKMEIDFNKNDVFSLALVIIECGTGFDINKLYTDYGFDTNILKFYFEEFKNKFQQNKLIISAIKAMLELNFRKRPNFVKLKKVLPPYDQICEFFNFQTKKSSPIVPRKKKIVNVNLSNVSNETPSFANYKNSNVSQNSSNISEFYLKEKNNAFENFNITKNNFVIKKKLDFEKEKNEMNIKYELRKDNFKKENINGLKKYFISKEKLLENLKQKGRIYKEDVKKNLKKRRFKQSVNKKKKKSKEKDKSSYITKQSKDDFIKKFKKNFNFAPENKNLKKKSSKLNFFNKRRNNICDNKNISLETDRIILKDKNIFDKKYSSRIVKKKPYNIRRISLNSRKSQGTLKKAKNVNKNFK